MKFRPSESGSGAKCMETVTVMMEKHEDGSSTPHKQPRICEVPPSPRRKHKRDLFNSKEDGDSCLAKILRTEDSSAASGSDSGALQKEEVYDSGISLDLTGSSSDSSKLPEVSVTKDSQGTTATQPLSDHPVQLPACPSQVSSSYKPSSVDKTLSSNSSGNAKERDSNGQNSDSILIENETSNSACPIGVSEATNSSKQNTAGTSSKENGSDHHNCSSNETVTSVMAEDTSRLSSAPLLTSTPVQSSGASSSRRCLSDVVTDITASWLRQILVKSKKGRLLLRAYDSQKYFAPDDRKKLVGLIIDSELEEDKATVLSPERLTSLAQVICKCFPTEIATTYYVLYFKDAFGRAHKAKGKLYDRYVYVRRGWLESGAIMGRQSFSTQGNAENDDTVAVDSNLEARRRWLKVNTEPWSDVETYMKLTYEARMKHYKDTGLEICDYYMHYDPFKDPKGYLLVEADYSIAYPDLSSIALFGKWEDLQPKILALGHRRSKKCDFASTLDSVGIDLSKTGKLSHSKSSQEFFKPEFSWFRGNEDKLFLWSH